MFKVCKTDAQKKLIKLKKNKLYPGSWINMINPSGEELEKVAGWIDWDVDALKSSLDIDERSRIEHEGQNFMVIVNLPLLDDDGQFDTVPCSMVFTPKNFVTLCPRENRIIGSFTKATADTLFSPGIRLILFGRLLPYFRQTGRCCFAVWRILSHTLYRL